MSSSKWSTAFVLLAATLVMGTAGIAAMDFSMDSTEAEISDPSADTSGVLDMGKDVQSTLGYLLPLLAFAAVPLGIAGIAGIAIVKRRNKPFTR
jgi:hypothetical protein